tara:strand:- start:1358 stop:1681 length:324 start_codon:yes stop_codon:yes gene_type:complete
MSKILHFPNNKSLLHQLQEITEELAELHGNLSKGYEALGQLEDIITEREKVYDAVLKRYAQAIGVENVPIGLLEFASKNLKVDIITGDITLEYDDEEEEDDPGPQAS